MPSQRRALVRPPDQPLVPRCKAVAATRAADPTRIWRTRGVSAPRSRCGVVPARRSAARSGPRAFRVDEFSTDLAETSLKPAMPQAGGLLPSGGAVAQLGDRV